MVRKNAWSQFCHKPFEVITLCSRKVASQNDADTWYAKHLNPSTPNTKTSSWCGSHTTEARDSGFSVTCSHRPVLVALSGGTGIRALPNPSSIGTCPATQPLLLRACNSLTARHTDLCHFFALCGIIRGLDCQHPWLLKSRSLSNKGSAFPQWNLCLGPIFFLCSDNLNTCLIGIFFLASIASN